MDAEMDSIITNTGVNEKYTMKQEFCASYLRVFTYLLMESDEIQFVSTQRNQQKLLYIARSYTLKRTNRNDKCWICASVKRRMRGCPGKLYTNLDASQVIRTGDHADVCRVDADAFYHQQQLNELKRLAAGDPRTPRNGRVFSNVAAGSEHNVLEPFEEIPRLLDSRQDLRHTAEQMTTKSGAQFLMYHSPINDMLIFANEAGVRLLAQSNCWCGDGTHKLLPVVYCLTVSEDLSTYSGIFKYSIPKRKNLPSKFIWRNLFAIN
ncbi:hypothetical protein T09_5687 [Trichinella sp. T9]|nr:hypothetical protein T09_5687 [Trichinella sp. T9]